MVLRVENAGVVYASSSVKGTSRSGSFVGFSNGFKGTGGIQVSQEAEAEASCEAGNSVQDTSSVPNEDLDLPANWRAGEKRVSLDEAATKVDDAEVPIHLWNEVLLEDLERQKEFTLEEEKALEILRRMVLCQWRHRLTRCFCGWIRCSECAFLESDALYRVYPMELPEKRKVQKKPTKAPKWKGCENCGKTDRKYGSWVRNAKLFQGRGGYSWQDKQLGKGEVIYDQSSFSGKGGYVWRSGGCIAYKKWRNKYLQSPSLCVRASVDAGIDCLTRASMASAWEWDS